MTSNRNCERLSPNGGVGNDGNCRRVVRRLFETDYKKGHPVGVKSTRTLTRAEAVQRYISLKTDLKRLKWQGQAQSLSDRDLGKKLDSLAEEVAQANNETCFENFLVSDREPGERR